MLEVAIISLEDPQTRKSILPVQDVEKIMVIDHVELASKFATYVGCQITTPRIILRRKRKVLP